MTDGRRVPPPAADSADDRRTLFSRDGLRLLVSLPDAPGRPVPRRWAVGLFGAYLVALALIVFWPTPVDRDTRDYLVTLIDLLQRLGAPEWVRYTVIEFSANILLFVPAGLFLVILAGPRRWWLGPLAGFGASSAIELGQLVFLPDRFATVNDVIANSVGAIIGTALALIVLLIHHRAAPRSPFRPEI
jgi:glycopeptide antibiotics resistance protein